MAEAGAEGFRRRHRRSTRDGKPLRGHEDEALARHLVLSHYDKHPLVVGVKRESNSIWQLMTSDNQIH